jgi:hypothetical protein
MTTIKSIAIDKINKAKSVKEIFNLIRFGENESHEVLKMIVENANDFTKDIALKGIEAYNDDVEMRVTEAGEEEFINKNIRPLSEKQVWCLSYQVWNNKNVYTS